MSHERAGIDDSLVNWWETKNYKLKDLRETKQVILKYQYPPQNGMMCRSKDI